MYFEKYKATATGIKYAALVACGLAGPSIMPLLVTRYGLQGALLLVEPWQCKQYNWYCLLGSRCFFKFCSIHIEKVLPASGSEDNKEQQTINDISKPQTQQVVPALPISSPYQPKLASHVVAISWKSMAAMLAKPDFYFLAIVYFAVNCTVAIHATTVLDYGRDKGALLENANYLQVYPAVVELVGRLVVPFLSDRVPFGNCLFAAAGLVGSSITLFGMTFDQSFVYFATVNTLFGACLGYVSCMQSVLITNYLGLERLPLFFGFVGLTLIPVSLGSLTILGWVQFLFGVQYHPLKTVKLITFSKERGSHRNDGGVDGCGDPIAEVTTERTNEDAAEVVPASADSAPLPTSTEASAVLALPHRYCSAIKGAGLSLVERLDYAEEVVYNTPGYPAAVL
ncbi:hypothetical protein HPB48_015086 [Haemaphysalis longicornis]|uniref:Monocarboxylate transporter n=1 Tax=Haemaphysalis longicornis TaxID=44386 RepID=A0A9J6GHN3_HAELO|nr:hypothetical protein HPB48_015086 [Haemaphysalis longicornis]